VGLFKADMVSSSGKLPQNLRELKVAITDAAANLDPDMIYEIVSGDGSSS